MKDKKLTRSADDRMLAGVAGGLAAYLEIDPVLVRLIFVLIALFGGGITGVAIYVVLWIVLPEAES